MKHTVIVAAGVALLAFTTPAVAFTTSDYQGSSDQFKAGYVFGVIETLVLTTGDGKDEAQRDALWHCVTENKINSEEAVRMVGRYILRSSDASAVPMLANVVRALAETCVGYLPAKQPEGQ